MMIINVIIKIPSWRHIVHHLRDNLDIRNIYMIRVQEHDVSTSSRSYP